MKKFIASICLTLVATQTLAAPFSETAKLMAAKAISQSNSLGTCISVSIVDQGGHLAYFEKQDCASIGSVDTSLQKAVSANAYRKPTSDFAKAANQGKVGIIAAKHLFAVDGGLPIAINGQHAGAIGIGGATSLQDEEIARYALPSTKPQ